MSLEDYNRHAQWGPLAGLPQNASEREGQAAYCDQLKKAGGFDPDGGGTYAPHVQTEPPRWMMQHAFKRGLAFFFGAQAVALAARTSSSMVSAILLVGLTTACGENAPATAENAATAEAPHNTAAPTVTKDAGRTAPATATIAVLPLRRGYYVRSETPCNRASRADVFSLVTRTGMNLNCTFKNIEKTGTTTYRVTEECSDGGAAWGRDDGTVTSTATYEIPNETSYKVTYEDGYESSARYCAQSSMSAEYRDNDISDVMF